MSDFSLSAKSNKDLNLTDNQEAAKLTSFPQYKKKKSVAKPKYKLFVLCPGTGKFVAFPHMQLCFYWKQNLNKSWKQT